MSIRLIVVFSYNYRNAIPFVLKIILPDFLTILQGKGQKEFMNPFYVAVDVYDRILVSDRDNHCVKVSLLCPLF